MPNNPHPTAFKIDKSIFDRFPDLRVGVVLAYGLDNRGENEEIIAALRWEEDRLMKELAGTLPAEHPHIAPWREAYRAFGANPRKYPSSIENLVGRVLRGSRIRHINKLVDTYNTVSLRYVVPVGGEDLDQMQGDIVLTIATDGEPPIILLGEEEARAPQPGEVIYKDDAGAICRRWNWKEAERTKLTEVTSNVILVIEALPPISPQTLEQAVSDLSELVKQFCGGEAENFILDSRASRVQIAIP